MVWAILALLGIPLWLCAVGLSLILHNRALRHSPGSVNVRRRRADKSRWTRGYGVWVHDVFQFRGSLAAWATSLTPVRDVVMLLPSASDRKKLHRIDAGPAIVRMIDDGGNHVDFATSSARVLELLGPFAAGSAQTELLPPARVAPPKGGTDSD